MTVRGGVSRRDACEGAGRRRGWPRCWSSVLPWPVGGGWVAIASKGGTPLPPKLMYVWHGSFTDELEDKVDPKAFNEMLTFDNDKRI